MRSVLVLILIVLVAGITVSLPFVQTKIGNYVTNTLNKQYKISINVEEVSLTVFGGMKLKKVLILDHHENILISANRIKTNIVDWSKIVNGDLIFGDIVLDSLYFNMTTYKNEKQSNLNYFIDSFKTNVPLSKKQFLLSAVKVKITNGRCSFIDENQLTPKNIDFTKLNLAATALKIYGSDVTATINSLSLQDHRGLQVEDLSTKFTYTQKQIKLQNLNLKTKESMLVGSFMMNYEIEDFLDFNNKVELDLKLKKSYLGSNDIRCFYNELGKNLQFKIKGRMRGTLNNLVLSNLKLSENNNTQIIGSLYFKNLFPSKGKTFYMNGKLSKLSSSFDGLVTILPKVLGKKLPVILRKLGKINAIGNTQLTSTSMNASFVLESALGKVKTDLTIDKMNQSENATYSGKIVLNKFDIGLLLGNKDLRKASINVDIHGRGFSKKSLSTSLKGNISQINFNKYNYRNIDVEGNFLSGIYKGKVESNDPNLKMNFDGLVDLSKKSTQYDFKINIENANLKKLNFVKDSISNFKGNIVLNLYGNTVDNLRGNIFMNETTYRNAKSTYSLDNFNIKSSFDINNVRTISVNSSEILQGEIVGKFKFNQLEKLVKNSLGSLYANFKPEKVIKGQFLKFNFALYNKIVEIFYPELSIAPNTTIKGNINSDRREFKLNFNSEKVVAYANTLDNIRVKIDNKNPLYNAFIELDSIKTEHYKIRDFSMINMTIKDTLFFRSEFKGGVKGHDYYNLNLYHTIDKDNNNVVGLNKSEIKFKDYLWFLNENETHDNQVVFDKSLNNFNFNNIILSHENQEVTFTGDIKGKAYKDFKLCFKDVDLKQITPLNTKFDINGKLNASINYKQNKFIYQPTASIQIENLNVNKITLGHLDFNITGNQSFKKFVVKSFIESDNLKSINVDGNFEIVDKSTILDLQLNLEKFNLGIFAPLGGDVISNIRGFASGSASIAGSLQKPEINGRLYVDDAGLKIPYLNVDYSLNKRTVVDLTDEKFLFNNNVLTDIKFGTKGNLNGSIEHQNFANWKLDLNIKAKKLVVLDTKDSDESAYYGIAFIDGLATIKGPANALFIKVNAKSEKGTSLKIPINNSENVIKNDFLHFLTTKEKFNINKGIADNIRNFKGLELEFDLDITPDAEVEVILDRNTGHGIRGKGNGTLLLQINTLGKFNMYGDFQAYEGIYNFKYGGLIDKKFSVKKGGFISWEGNPMKARLNLEAIYKTSANPSVLLENSSFNKKIDVNVVIGVRGNLTSPEPDFNFEFPTVSNVLKSEIEYKLGNKEVRQTQALYLLSAGSFLSSEGVNQSAFSQSAFETASSLLSGIIQSKNDKFQVNIDIIGADRTVGRETDGRFVASVSSKINERITINGKVGVPFGGITQTAVVGDVEVLYRVNEDGTVNLRFFNRENDISYIGEGIGYTQGLGISYEVDFDTFVELYSKIFKNKQLKTTLKQSQIQDDSSFDLDQKKQSKPNNNNSKILNPNSEGRIPEED